MPSWISCLICGWPEHSSHADSSTVMSNRTLVHTLQVPRRVHGMATSINLRRRLWESRIRKDVQCVGDGDCRRLDTGVDPPIRRCKGFCYKVRLHSEQARRFRAERYFSSPCPFASCPPPSCPTCSPAKVNQSTAAVLDQSTAAVLDGSPVCGIWTRDDGDGHHPPGGSDREALALEGVSFGWTASLSDILRAIYYGVQNGANVIT